MLGSPVLIPRACLSTLCSIKTTTNMMPTNYSLAPYTTNKTLPSVFDRNASSRKRKADIALGSPAGSPLKHQRGKGVDEYDLDGLCIFDSLGISGLTIRHDDNGEAHLVIGSGTVSSMPLKMTHRHIIWGSHSVNPVVALPWQEGPSADGTFSATEADVNLFLSITDGDVDWFAEGVIDALLGSFDDSSCNLDGFDLSGTTATDETPAIISADDTAASPMHCDFYEIWPHLDADKDLGQDISFDEI